MKTATKAVIAVGVVAAAVGGYFLYNYIQRVQAGDVPIQKQGSNAPGSRQVFTTVPYSLSVPGGFRRTNIA